MLSSAMRTLRRPRQNVPFPWETRLLAAARLRWNGTCYHLMKDVAAAAGELFDVFSAGMVYMEND